ncbi:MAG: H-NS histone family protein [bacterium]|nr:H-NS histone family protein [bacterium]
MSEFIKILTRKNSFRKNIAELDSETLERVAENLALFIDERKNQEAAAAAEAASKQAKIDEIRKMMSEAGLSFDDVVDSIDVTKPKTKVTAKYRFLDKNGEQVEWSGRGRTPVAIKEYVDNGGALADLLI